MRVLRVQVHVPGEEDVKIHVDRVGTVHRIRYGDDGAFVHLDERFHDKRVHWFEETDRRATSVMAWPEDCEPA